MKLAFAILIASLVTLSSFAQAPHADWQTIETEHFRFHFPVEYEEWTRLAAGRMESIRERLIAEIGYAPPQKIDVLIMDPMAQANGSAWPFLANARMVLWTNPPGPESVIGNHADWIELLAVHEEAHLVHLLRPSRNPMRQLMSRLLPLGPIGLASPRWVSEGYATVMEGDFTGSGRPNSAIRASILREWARAGRLPSYGQMANDSGSFMGMSMAYLMGSAYLEWLREREGPDSLRNLWARLTARKTRSFDEAFTGVFGDSPARLYARFTAELTHSALEIEAQQEGAIREGELWQDLEWATGEPAVSNDGTRLLTVFRSRENPEKLVVLSTEENTKAEEKWNEEVRKILERDPEDVAAVRRRPLPREPLFELAASDRSQHFLTPRWIAGNDAILFSRYEPDSEGVLHPDLYRWRLTEGSVERLTRGADLRDADASADGSWAIAVRNRWGKSQLVRVDLSTAEVTEVTPATVTPIYDSPRISPDGRRIVYVRHDERAWRLIVRDVASGNERVLFPTATPQTGTSVAQPAWSSGGESVYASLFQNGFIDVARFPLDGSALERITRTRSAALAPAPSPDGLYFLALERDGFDIRFITTDQTAPEFTLARSAWPLAGMPDTRSVTPFEVRELAPSRPYGTGRQELSFLFGGGYAPGNDMYELGLRLGDVVGRSNVLAIGSFGGDDGFEGGAIAGAWRGFPVELNAHLFSASEQLDDENAQGIEQAGGEFGAAWDRQWRNRTLDVAAGFLVQQVEGFAVDEDQTSLFVSPDYRGFVGYGSWRLLYGGSAWIQSGRTGDDDWNRLVGAVSLGVGSDSSSLRVGYTRGRIDDGVSDADRFKLGGVKPSILARSAYTDRVAVPALELRTLTGTEFESQAADVQLGDLPLGGFYERHRVFDRGDSDDDDWLELAGLRVTLSTDSLPLLGIPGLDLELGVAQILSGPLDGDTNWWITTSWRP